VPDAAKGAYFPLIHPNGQAGELIYGKQGASSALNDKPQMYAKLFKDFNLELMLCMSPKHHLRLFASFAAN